MTTIKSIKEKAEEYDRVLKRISPNESIVDIYGRKQFEEGANYVLEQIEEMLVLKNQYTNKCDFCDDLEWRIEQLKK